MIQNSHSRSESFNGLRDRDLAKQMGEQAQKEARELYSNERLEKSFKAIEAL